MLKHENDILPFNPGQTIAIAGAAADSIGYVSAHGTATPHGDIAESQATAEVLCRMLPMLTARGLTRFGDVIEATRKHGRLLEDLN